MSTSEGPFPMETTYAWEDAPGAGTRMTLRNRGEPAGFSKVAAPLMASAIRRANRKDLQALKRVLENLHRSCARLGLGRLPRLVIGCSRLASPGMPSWWSGAIIHV